jgi:hypothetical protein
VALVCRRFAAAACAPQLLRNVELPRIRSLGTLLCLGTWLTRHGAHVRQLEFDGEAAHEEDAGSFSLAVAACLAAVGAAGQLAELSLAVRPTLHSEWLCAMRSLRRLSLAGWTAHVSAAIAGLSSLQSLELHGMVELADEAALPTSVTRLLVEDD